MTQLDVPNISFSHYLDLLKRRTWHVVLVSVFGLVIGGFVALMIPRFYVVSTTLEFEASALAPFGKDGPDPLTQVVKEARSTIPRGIERAIQELGWPEASLTGLARQDFIAGVRERLHAYDPGMDTSGPRRQFAELRIQYADTEGQRAVEMVEKLRDLWLRGYVQGLEQRAQADVDVIRTRHDAVLGQQKAANEALSLFEKNNDLNPMLWRSLESFGGGRDLGNRIDSFEDQLIDLQSQILQLEKEQEERRARLEVTKEMVPATLEERIPDPLLRSEYERKLKEVMLAQLRMKRFLPHTSHYRSALALVEDLKGELTLLEQSAGGGFDKLEKKNPDYEALDKEIRLVDAKLEGLRSDEKRKQGMLDELRKRASDLPGIFKQYRELRADLTRFDKQVAELDEELTKAQNLLYRARSDKPYRISEQAFAPATPNDPNPVLLALIGCGVGLGLAIGLILLIDLLQLTYKSVDDVESALGVPVLGSIAFLQTDEELRDLRSRRVWMTVAATLFIGSLVTVVALYYVNKTQLPEFMVDILDVLLGANTGGGG